MFRGFRENGRCLYMILSIYLEKFPDSFYKIFYKILVLKMFLLCYHLMVWWLLEMKGHLLANVSKREYKGTFVLMSFISFVLEIPQKLIAIKNH